jgi:hypothetical protein
MTAKGRVNESSSGKPAKVKESQSTFSLEENSMRTIILLATLTLGATAAQAEPEVITRTLKDTTTIVSVALNEQTVFCTDRGYGNVQLKVSVPDLNWLAHFDHRVVGEGLPCITGGLCDAVRNPGAILDPEHPLESVPVRVVLTETLSLDHDAKTCTRFLTEEVTSLIRRHKFEHYRYSDDVAPVAFEQCLAVRGL